MEVIWEIIRQPMLDGLRTQENGTQTQAATSGTESRKKSSGMTQQQLTGRSSIMKKTIVGLLTNFLLKTLDSLRFNIGLLIIIIAVLIDPNFLPRNTSYNL